MSYHNQAFDAEESTSKKTHEIKLPRVQRVRYDPPFPPKDITKYELPDGKGMYLRSANEFFPKLAESNGPRSQQMGPVVDRSSTSDRDIERQSPEEDYSLFSFFKKKRKNGDRHGFVKKRKSPWIQKIFWSVLALLYIAYFVYVLMVVSKLQKKDYWCRGDGLLISLTSVVAFGLLYFKVLKPLLGRHIKKFLSPAMKKIGKLLSIRCAKVVLLVVLLALIGIFLYFDTRGELYRLRSIAGVVALLTFGFVFSAAPRKIYWRHTIWGMLLQFTLAMVLLRWPTGRLIFGCISDKVALFLAFTDKGSTFVFGSLVDKLHLFAFQVLPVTLFFSFFTSILFYLGAVQWLVLKLGWLLQVTAGTTLCESVNAAANIFLGMTEAPLLIKPYLPKMTKSELHAVMTGGFATIAGSVMAAYISFGISPSHLLTASIMNAPAALGMALLFYPELEQTKIDESSIKTIKSQEINVLHAACVGVTNALPLVANIAGNLIAFIAFLDFINVFMDWGCQLANLEEGVCSLETIFGYIFQPVAWVLGVQWVECYYVAQLIGLKITINEFVAYGKLAEFQRANLLSPRAEALSTYALCGFSNISAIGIMMGGLASLAPERKSDMAQVVVRAMIAGSMATFMSTSIAGILLSENDVIPSSNITNIIANATGGGL